MSQPQSQPSWVGVTATVSLVGSYLPFSIDMRDILHKGSDGFPHAFKIKVLPNLCQGFHETQMCPSLLMALLEDPQYWV